MTTTLPPAPDFGAPLPIEPHQAVLDFLALRRSASALSLQAPAPDAAQLADLLRLAVRVPDHGKLAPWRFVILEGAAKAALADRLEAIAYNHSQVAKLGKLRAPPLGVAVISAPLESAIPEWEQLMSAAAVCTNLLYGAMAMGFGANWITDWYSYDPRALEILGVGPAEKVAAFMLLGTPREPPLERERPDPAKITTYWTP